MPSYFQLWATPLIILKKYDNIIRFRPTWPIAPSHPAVVFRTKRGKSSGTGTILPLNLLGITTRVESCNKMQLWRGVFWKTNTEKLVVSLITVEFQEGAKGINITCESPAAFEVKLNSPSFNWMKIIWKIISKNYQENDKFFSEFN